MRHGEQRQRRVVGDHAGQRPGINMAEASAVGHALPVGDDEEVRGHNTEKIIASQEAMRGERGNRNNNPSTASIISTAIVAWRVHRPGTSP